MRWAFILVRSKTKHNGLSLIELAVVLAIISLVGLAGLSYGLSWVANSKISRTNSDLKSVYRKAVSHALQNPLGVTGNSAAAEVKIVSGTIQLSSGNGTVLWSSAIPSGVTAKIIDSVCSDTTRLSSNGIPINVACTKYRISASGGHEINGQLN